MNQISTSNVSRGRVIGASAIAAGAALVHPFAMLFRVMTPFPVPSMLMITCAMLYAWAGIVPVAVMGIVGVAASFLFMGWSLALASLPMYALPMVFIVIAQKKRWHFFRQMTAVTAASMGGVLLGVAIAAAFYGTDMVARFVDEFRLIYSEMMPTLWEMNQLMLQSSGVSLTYEEFASIYYDVLSILQQYYELYLPGNLLTGAAMSGVIAVFFGNWKAAKNGNATSESFIGLHGWYLPSNLTLGLLMILVVSAVLRAVQYNGAETVWVTVLSLVQFACIVQAMASMDRRLKMQGATRRRRTVMACLTVLLCLVGGMLIYIYVIMGAMSALFGSRGAIRLWLEKHKENNDQ